MTVSYGFADCSFSFKHLTVPMLGTATWVVNFAIHLTDMHNCTSYLRTTMHEYLGSSQTNKCELDASLDAVLTTVRFHKMCYDLTRPRRLPR
ncbi:hypothetical protein J6590_014133 [Homalodisca vitripennis]|nr:hypothetical protein J6590_014133 [Homalodisca vitripennis]